MKNRILKIIISDIPASVVAFVIISVVVIVLLPFILFRTFWFWLNSDDGIKDCWEAAWET